MIQGLPERLRTLRTKYGYSQKQVADRLGVSASIISSYETGERTPSTEVLLSLSNLYQCRVDYLLGKENETPPVVLSTEGLTDQQIEAVRRVIDSMKNQ